jgi:regulator of PEP synthase PpsR (kinase-PPPase family)
MKKIYILSDGTGQSALNIVRAAIVQFEHPHSRITVFPKVETTQRLKSILDQAKSVDAFVTFTFAKAASRNYVAEYCPANNIRHLDILGPLIDNLSTYLNLSPLETPTLLRKVDERYFKRMEAIDFTINHDDGRGAGNYLNDAEIVLLGLSRTSKTPTSFYIAQEGYRVANIPVIPGIPLPEELFKINQNKIAFLVMDPDALQKIRISRLAHYNTESRYVDLKAIYEEVEFARDLSNRNRKWKVIDVTNKSVEETSREIIDHVIGRDQEYYQ